MKSVKYVLCGLFLWSLPVTCFALGETESMRCNNGIVSPGDTRQEVIEKCGQPAEKRYRGKSYTYAGVKYYSTEEWVYDFGKNEFVYIALINRDKVSLLYSTREYGKK